MSKLQNIIHHENIEDVEYSEIMSSNYVSYAMSVIISRAVPDVRDGLKPVHRRFIYDMKELSTTHDKPHRKSARIVGDTLGKYHPHGDCLHADTRIKLLSGETKTIKELYDLQQDQWVLSVDDSGNLVPAIAHDFRIGQYASQLYDIEFNNGYVITATNNHPFLTIEGEWVKAENLHPNMILDVTHYTMAGEYPTVSHNCKNTSQVHTLSNLFDSYDDFCIYRDDNLPIIKSVTIRESSECIPMYDFTVDNHHNMIICADNHDHMYVCAHNSSVYDAMVVKAQPWKQMQPLVDGHGNFGSLEGDPPAADRYTEARLQKFTEDIFLDDLKYDTVDMQPSYDETEKEPEVLPCKLPHVLINGAEGIAVGMTTAIPTHNTGEVIDAAIAYLKGERKLEKLMKVLPGPDFPTGGIISNQHEILGIYSTGTGKIKIRGKMQFEPGKNGEKDKLVVTEIPYTMIGEGINKFLQDVANLVEDKMLPEIIDIINQSSGEDIRIVFELKPKADINRIQNILYKKTKLEDTFGVNMLVIDHGRPIVMNLMQILDAFEQFQYQIYTRKYQKLLAQAEKKQEVDEGLVHAIEEIDTVIAVLRGNKNKDIVRHCLMTGDTSEINFKDKALKSAASKFRFTEIQTDAILAMQLMRLIGMESDVIVQELDKINQSIEDYKRILASPVEMNKEIIKFLQSMKKQYAVARKTELTDVQTTEIEEIEIPEVAMTVLIDKFNYIHAIEQSAYSRNKQFIDENFVHVIDISSRDKLAVFTDIGKVHMIPMKDVPTKKPRDKGVPLDNICEFDYKAEHIVGVEALGFKREDKLFVFVTSSGLIKMTKNSEFFINRKITDSTVLREGDQVFSVFRYTPKGQIIFETQKGLVLKELQDNIKTKSKYSQGIQGIKLNSGDELKLVTTDGTSYADVRKGQFGTSGKVRTKKLM